MNNAKNNIDGTEGENIVNRFIDKKLTKLISFPNPKTKDKAQVCDNLIWLNHDAILIEVKTRTEGKTTLEKWARSRIQEGVSQLSKNYKKIKNGKRITLHNRYFDTVLDNNSLTNILGLIILVHDEELKIFPSESENEIYNQEFPIQVLSIKDLNQLSKEIDTLQDFIWYLMDRFNYLNKCDIKTCCELEPLGYYYANKYSFPLENVDFNKTNYWDKYQIDFEKNIIERNEENKSSKWIDILEKNYTKHRKLHEGLPTGLFFIWEFGSLHRRYRTKIGKKLDTVQTWFNKGKIERKFAYQNGKTTNWHIFFFMRGSDKQIEIRLNELVRLKQIVEVHKNNFRYAIYAIGYKISVLDPPQLMGLRYSTFDCDNDILEKRYSNSELSIAQTIWGQNKEEQLFEFPNED